MKKWEDILKDRLEGYESTLPEGSLAEFRALRTAGGAVSRKKAHPLVWTVAAAVAAGLAAVLLLRKPVGPEEGIQVIRQPAVVQADDTTDVVAPVAATPLIAHVTHPGAARRPATPEPEEIVPTAVPEEVVPVIEPEKPAVPETEEVVPQDVPAEPTVDKPAPADSSPFIPLSGRDKAVRVNVVPGAAAAGGGLLAAAATQFAKTSAEQFLYENDADDWDEEERISHRMPLMVGLSARIPVTEKLGITTGLEYSMYSSLYTHSRLYGPHAQYVHYLGIPVRLDWSFASSRWYDAYLGAGVKGDVCLGATFEGEDIGKDGPAFRLLGAGGVQFNATRRLGLYVEPAISWTIPSERRVLSTYSSEHPFMFTVAAGVRVNLGK